MVDESTTAATPHAEVRGSTVNVEPFRGRVEAAVVIGSLLTIIVAFAVAYFCPPDGHGKTPKGADAAAADGAESNAAAANKVAPPPPPPAGKATAAQ